ncbi:hypothetical protein FB45DRAFT_1020665 [Roridomyces roridus]|uniref:Uncharacterized protein n=1 Tax=Roridomyces roridus TaxID=1738132 RepID=A0AAD7FXN1_9AGAR|nr:hypothetical protein FB45DRAFT_1020665 [Roridomyces roridus]
MLSRRVASAKYREANAEELREKARERMRRLREKRKDNPVDLEKQRARECESSRKYRQSHSSALAHRQRIRRMDAFEKKHGHVAWSERCAKLEVQRRVAAEDEEWRLYEAELRRRWHDDDAANSSQLAQN